MGEKNCDSCRSWVDEIYWTHFQFLQFAQFLRGSYDQQLALPKTFSDNLKKKLPGNVTLRGPGGIVWNIGLMTRDDTLYFTNGWQQFVKDHSLKENDFLVFKYNGESLFDVLIFDGESYCEKAASYFVRKCGHAEDWGGCFSKRRDVDNSLKEVNTPSNAGVECAYPKKYVHLNSDKVPLAVPLETPTEKTFNAGVECAYPKKYVHLNSDKVPLAAPLETPTEKTFNAGVECAYPKKCVHLNSDKVPLAEPLETPTEKTFNAGVECAYPKKYVHLNSDKVPLAVPLETPTEKTFNAGVESACPEEVMADGFTEPAAVPSQPNGKRTRKVVSAVKQVQIKQRGKLPKVSNSHDTALNWETESELDSVAKTVTNELYTSNRRPVTENEKKNALQLAQETCSIDSLYVVMRPTHVYRRFFVSIPNKWIIEHLSARSQDVILRMGNAEWTVRYNFRNFRQMGGLLGGWKRFSLENNLEEYDVCVFTPAGQINDTFILDVNIFRVVEEIVLLTAVNSPEKRGRKKLIKAI
ncbi:B3 domain-containing protein REM16-like isoform X2 [Gastrolobium bilobum]|uniref:B3 domain-containing protein REM16-like isoform X2 n=1 Tax=Gastrolobium bilobum TaxID=150636 RepID=UPI002AB05E76|nr:B3 domain-containing protein REM16-like isoform X2 [Gastrolobium bilobum]